MPYRINGHTYPHASWACDAHGYDTHRLEDWDALDRMTDADLDAEHAAEYPDYDPASVHELTRAVRDYLEEFSTQEPDNVPTVYVPGEGWACI